ncbi:PHD and RING finger domain-containing protein 1 isoform X2 [Hyla sarda]|uniref:PHD and RING finger domain-containing protein 1 isoform X2 n=1 Tax=Hyla sarda TaxID=327740 RepID=UPI0024C40B4D|nr:PHD and RING finger domain-containing protein 1 isoform X2 [Hyla sarda]
MDDEENQDQLINRNTSQGKSRRQGPFVASDDEDVEESDGSGSEEDDDMEEEDGEEEDGSEEEEEEDDEEDLPVGSSDPTLSTVDLNEGMSSDEERENCPICLNGFRDQVVGTPENCNHYFCLDCIVEWSKNANSCPVDRITFSCIHIRAHYGGEILKKVPVQSKADENLIVDDNPTNCEVCGRSDREDRLLLCDGCDAGYHMECLTPPLNAVPVDEWFCPECAAANQPDDDAVSEEEVTSLLADVVPTTSRLRTNVIRTRAIARTRQSERVRASVNRIRTTARSSQNVPRYLLSSLLDETIEAVVAGLNTAVYQRNLTPRTTTTRRKRKTGKKTSQSKVSKGSRGVRKKRKRRVRRRRVRKLINRKVSTSHSRIARSLGIRSPPRGSSMPRIQRAPEHTLDSMRQDIGAATFSVFGNPNDLDPFDSQDDQVSNSSSPLTAKRRVLSRSALRSHQPVARPISVGLSRGRVSSLASESVAVAEPVPDLLGSILSGQSILMMKSSDIVISRDGSLTAKKSGEVSAQNSNSREDTTPAGFMESSPSHSGSPTISSSINTWKPVVQQPSLSFPSSDLYSLSPAPSPPPASPSSKGMDRLSVPNSSTPGISAFRLKNAFTPRIVQVQSSTGRLASKGAEPPRLNGSLHKPESPSLNDPIPPKPPEVKHSSKPSAKRMEISEFPRIPKIKKETDISPNSEDSRRLSATSDSAYSSLPRPGMNQLTGRGENRQLGRFATTQNTEKNTRQESQAPSRPSGGISSSHTASGSSKAPLSNSRNVGSSDSGGGGLRITISGSSTNSCRQFSPSAKDPFRSSEGKTQQKATSHPSTVKREKTVKNEIYDPFEPTGSDSGSGNSPSPERPATPPIPSTSTVNTNTTQSSGVKVGAFRSFKFTTHSSRVAVSKLGPDFSGMSPNNKEPHDANSPVSVSPVSPPPLKVEEIKKEIKKEKIEHTPLRLSCPLSGLKITSDLKAGGTRGFHFDVEDQPKISIKSEPDILPNRTVHQNTAGNRVVWESETPSESSSLSISHSIEPPKRTITVKEEPKSCSRSRSRTPSRGRESRSASLSTEDRERKSKSKSHKVKRSRSDRSSSGSWERSKKKRQKERKKEKKRKSTESRERKRSRSSSHSSSSPRTYNSKKKKKKKRDSRSESAGRSISPEKEKKRKHKSDKSYSNKEGSSKVKEKKKPKEDRGKQRSRSQPVTKEFKAHKSRDKSPTFRDQEVTRHIVLSPNNNETTITCTVSFKSESPTTVQETKKSILVPKEEVHERHTFQYLEDSVSIKEEKKVELSDCDEEIKMEAESPPWSPSLLDSLVPECKNEEFQEPPSPKESSPFNYLLTTSVVSPQASSLSNDTEPASPKPQSPLPSSRGDHSKSTAVLNVKKEADDLQWSPSHLDDFLLNELSDDVCSVGAVSPDDVDLEEAILMKREGDCKEPIEINFSKKAVIPFLQEDETSGDGGAGNHIGGKTTNNRNSTVEAGKSDGLKEEAASSIPKSKPQIKRVTWNLHHKESDKNATTEKSASPPYCSTQSEAWADVPKFTVNQITSSNPDPSSESSSPLAWNTLDTSLQGSDQLQPASQGSWNTENRTQNNVLGKPEEHAVNKPVAASMDRHTTQQVKDTSQIPWITTDAPAQVFPQTLPPLPLPPVFPPYAPMSEPTVPCVTQSSRTMPSQTPKPGSLATANEPKMQAASTGEGKGKSKPKKGEKLKNEEYMKKLHMQERAVEEVKLAIKPYYQKREITKDEYKEILRKAVQKICHSKSGEINPVKVVNLVKGYVDKYKHIRNKQKKSGTFEDHDFGRDSPI